MNKSDAIAQNMAYSRNIHRPERGNAWNVRNASQVLTPGLAMGGISSAKGFVLVTALLFLLVLTMLGISSLQGSTFQERMAGNLRDRNLALQAAELALRDAARDLATKKADGISYCLADGAGCRPWPERPKDVTQVDGFWKMSGELRQSWTPNCNHDQCYSTDNVTESKPVWDETVAKWGAGSGSKDTVVYGTYTGATAIAGVAAQPRYIMELFSPEDPYGTGDTQQVAIRVTARAVGQSNDSVVMLQTVLVP